MNSRLKEERGRLEEKHWPQEVNSRSAHSYLSRVFREKTMSHLGVTLQNSRHSPAEENPEPGPQVVLE